MEDLFMAPVIIQGIIWGIAGGIVAVLAYKRYHQKKKEDWDGYDN